MGASDERSNDSTFAEKVEDIVGHYMYPPAHAVVLLSDESARSRPAEREKQVSALHGCPDPFPVLGRR